MPPKGKAFLDGKEYDVLKLKALARKAYGGLAHNDWPVSSKYFTHRVWEGSTPAEELLSDRKSHKRRIWEADLCEPILIEPRHGRVIDGYHRIIKALLGGVTWLPYRRLNHAMMDLAYVRELTPYELNHHNQNKVFGTEKEIIERS